MEGGIEKSLRVFLGSQFMKAPRHGRGASAVKGADSELGSSWICVGAEQSIDSVVAGGEGDAVGGGAGGEEGGY